MATKMLNGRGADRIDHERAAVQLAQAVLIERIRSLPEDDRRDLFELVKVLFTAEDREEVDSAAEAMVEILDQSSVRVMRQNEVKPGRELDGWVTFVSDRIRELRRAANMTQEELAKASGLPQSHISRLERREHSPSFATLEKLATGLGVPVSDLDPSAE